MGCTRYQQPQQQCVCGDLGHASQSHGRHTHAGAQSAKRGLGCLGVADGLGRPAPQPASPALKTQALRADTQPRHCPGLFCACTCQLNLRRAAHESARPRSARRAPGPLAGVATTGDARLACRCAAKLRARSIELRLHQTRERRHRCVVHLGAWRVESGLSWPAMLGLRLPSVKLN